MIKDKLSSISDELAIKVATILLKNSTSCLYNYTFEKIQRHKYDKQEGSDAEEAIYVWFKAILKHEQYKTSGWKNYKVRIDLIQQCTYSDHSHFSAYELQEGKSTLSHRYISNYIEAVELLQNEKII